MVYACHVRVRKRLVIVPQRIWITAIVGVVSANVSLAAKAGRSYVLPLVGEFGVYKSESDRAPDLVQMSDPGRGGGRLILKDVTKCGTWGRLIFGHDGPKYEGLFSRTPRRYFIFDTSQKSDFPEPVFYASIEEWRTALSTAGVPATSEVIDPEEAATTRPDREIHPWEYTTFKGRYGLSDGDLFYIAFLVFLGICFLVCFVFPFKFVIWSMGILTGLVLLFGADVSESMTRQGLTRFAPPVFPVIAGYAGARVRRWVRRHREQLESRS